ncbi:MAG: 50S ribosomal protein L31e [Nanoarchaeota archaeon]|nr:50S ribosomal protein L31e [Nanoarchaeota archaeon]
MADKKDQTPVLERTYNVPLRREYQKAPRWKRTEKAVVGLRQFLGKHMKSEKVLLSTTLNNLLWKHGIKNPPHHVKVTAVKDKEGVVHAELFGVKKEEPKATKKVVKEESKDATTEPVAEKPKKVAKKTKEAVAE